VNRELLLNLLAALSYAAGATFMKASDGLRNVVPAVLVYVCFAVGATMQSIAVRHQEVGISNTVVLGVEAIGAVALGILFFHESISLTKFAAVGLVGAGVYLLRA
jgi:multidrug transporter EmrE-like cation transporter